jgi:hypothetical protein
MHRLSFVVGLLVLSLGAVSPASARPPEKLTCPNKHVVVRIDEKACPPTPKRPLHIRKRVCCQRPSGQINCHPFHPCPPNSPN